MVGVNKIRTMRAMLYGAKEFFMNNKKMVNKIGFGASCLALISLCLFSGCQKKEVVASDELEKTLSIYTWMYYTSPVVLEKFEKEFKVHVICDQYASNEEMYAKIQSGASGYDIVFPSADFVSIMIAQDMLKKLDHSKIPNLANINPAVLKKATYDAAMDYSVPYYWGASGIMVNTAHVPDFEKDWNIFARKDLAGKMVMLDDMREVLGDALVTLGYSVNTRDATEIGEAADLVNNVWKPNLVKFDAEAFGKGYASGDFWVVQGYIETVMEEIGSNEELRKNTVAFIPSIGGPAYIDSMCIMSGSKHSNAAHAFINFIHRPEIYAEFLNYFHFPAAVNPSAAEFIDGPTIYTAEDLAPTEVKEDVGDALDIYNDVWFNKIRIGK
jgi:spermidine/putrescine transport system substrate-binding protein